MPPPYSPKLQLSPKYDRYDPESRVKSDFGSYPSCALGCVDRVACLVKSPTGNVEPKLQTYFSSYSHDLQSFSSYKWASFAKASGLRAISTLNSARRKSVKFARKCECGSSFFSTSQASSGLTSGDSFQLRAAFDTFGRYRSWTMSSRSVCTCSENRRDRHGARDPEWAPEWRFFELWGKLRNVMYVQCAVRIHAARNRGEIFRNLSTGKSGRTQLCGSVWTNSKLNNIHSLARPSYVVKRKTSYSKQSLTRQ
ncbi:hypothetical protein G5I_00681 [Acromyrmex echinatior]|uniref:Uncharacterized protein n=1 Tax=Acromyrmex echinatior TaxID=103372 RepID=F4W5I4_ACREC|nr:hypothetical protein G5I_00681 [Acromyrmex echinatior]